MRNLRFHVSREEWDRENPRFVHPKHGPVKCPDILLWQIEETPDCCDEGCHKCADLWVQVARLNAWSSWDEPEHSDNVAHWEEAKAMAAALNLGWGAMHADATVN